MQCSGCTRLIASSLCWWLNKCSTCSCVYLWKGEMIVVYPQKAWVLPRSIVLEDTNFNFCFFLLIGSNSNLPFSWKRCFASSIFVLLHGYACKHVNLTHVSFCTWWSFGRAWNGQTRSTPTWLLCKWRTTSQTLLKRTPSTSTGSCAMSVSSTRKGSLTSRKSSASL